MGQIGVGIVC